MLLSWTVTTIYDRIVVGNLGLSLKVQEDDYVERRSSKFKKKCL